MSRRIVIQFVTFILVFFSYVHIARASFEITEIMYDLDGTDTNREWVEVKNTGTESADLSKWFLFTDNTKHSLAPQSESNVPAGGYAVIAQNAPKFKIDWPNYSGLLFDSSWTGFSNDGETIALKDPDQNSVSQVNFTSSMGGAGDGNSLQKVNGSWVGAIPTPGMENQGNQGGGGGTGGSGSGGSSDGGTSGGGSSTSTVVTKKKEVEVPKIITNIIANTTVFAGIPFVVDASTIGLNKEPLTYGRFVWNFGDGSTKEETVHTPFQYEYQYPGQYVLSLSYYHIVTSTTVDVTDRLIITVLPSQISISSVGREGDVFVELENKSNIEVDLSGWTLKGILSTFTIPQGTIILPHQKLKLSEKVTHFSSSDKSVLLLLNTLGETTATYPSKVHSTYSTHDSSHGSSQSSTPTVINLNDLGASAANAQGFAIPTSTFAWVGLIGIIIIGLVAVLLIRKRTPQEYLDKDIRAEDMTIIE